MSDCDQTVLACSHYSAWISKNSIICRFSQSSGIALES